MSLIEFDEVSFNYRTQSDNEFALNEVSFNVESGDFLGITGPTDAGKSSIARAIASYIPNFFDGDFSGTVTVDGQTTTETTIGELSDQVGMLFEDPFDQLTGSSTTVFEEVAFGLENRGLSKDEIINRVYNSLETTGLADQLDRNPQQLSGGQTQRLALASILALDPALLVLDEPTSQLDPQGTNEIFEIVAGMDSSEYTVVVISQNLQQLVSHVDRLLVLNDGDVGYKGSPTDVLVQDEVSQLISVPPTVQIGMELRNQGLIDEAKPVPLDIDAAVAELEPHITSAQHHETETQHVSDGSGIEPNSTMDTSNGAGDTPLLELDDVHYSYSESIHALQGISLSMNGGCVCLIGQNGAGKSTFAKHLNGLLKPTDGRMLVRGTDTQKSRVAELAHDVGLNFQDPDDQLFHNTVEEEMHYGPQNLGFSEEEIETAVESALKRMRLADVRSKNPYDLGLARRKQAAVASVLAMDTPVVVLDEPTGGQDAPGTELLVSVIRELVADGKLVIVITHNMAFVRDTADRVIALNQGEVLLDDGPESVFEEEEALARTDVTPPIVTQIGHRLGLPHTILSTNDLFEFVDTV